MSDEPKLPAVPDQAPPVAADDAPTITSGESQALNKRLGIKLFKSPKCDLSHIGKALAKSNAVHAGRGIYLLASDHVVRALKSAAKTLKDMEKQGFGEGSDYTLEDKRLWTRAYNDLIKTAQDLGMNVIKSETILRELPKPTRTQMSFAPGQIINANTGPTQVVVKQIAEPSDNKAVDPKVNGE